MENSFQTSFIPKKPIVSNGASPISNNKAVSISMIVSVFIIVVIILSSFGLFLYKDYLTKNKADLIDSLSKAKNSFDSATIGELELYDQRTGAAKSILDNHIILSPLFELINKLTLSSIQYTAFNHESKDGTFSVKMSGIARDYKSIALQSEVFNKEEGGKFNDVIFSNLTKNKENLVTFDLEFNVDPSLLSYTKSIANIEPTKTEVPAATNDTVIQTNESNITSGSTTDTSNTLN